MGERNRTPREVWINLYDGILGAPHRAQRDADEMSCRCPSIARRYVLAPKKPAKKKPSACVTIACATVVYLSDGTKVELRREGNRAWLEHVPQDTMRVAKKKAWLK